MAEESRAQVYQITEQPGISKDKQDPYLTSTTEVNTKSKTRHHQSSNLGSTNFCDGLFECCFCACIWAHCCSDSDSSGCCSCDGCGDCGDCNGCDCNGCDCNGCDCNGCDCSGCNC